MYVNSFYYSFPSFSFQKKRDYGEQADKKKKTLFPVAVLLLFKKPQKGSGHVKEDPTAVMARIQVFVLKPRAKGDYY